MMVQPDLSFFCLFVIHHWKGNFQIYKRVQPDLSFCCWLFVKSSYTSLESKNSDLQDGMIRFVDMLLLVLKIQDIHH